MLRRRGERCRKHLALVNLTEGSAESKDICIRLQSAISEICRAADGIAARGTRGVFYTGGFANERISTTCFTEQLM